jgi:hypothetical protein
MIKRLSIAAAASLLALTPACDSSEEAGATAPAPEAVGNASTKQATSVPVKEDFELEAEVSIDEDNLEDAVGSLESEIGNDES